MKNMFNAILATLMSEYGYTDAVSFIGCDDGVIATERRIAREMGITTEELKAIPEFKKWINDLYWG